MRHTSARRLHWHACDPVTKALPIALALLCLLVAACSSGASTTATRSRGAITPGATAAPTLDPRAQASAIRNSLEYRIRATVSADLARMSLDEKLGQLFLIETGWQQYNADVDAMVRGMHAGAVILYQQNMASAPQLKDFVAAMQARAGIPLLVTIDEEGGVVDRLGYLGFDTPLPAAQDLAASGNPALARQAGAQSAAELKALGINTNLAPVADVRTVPNAVEFTRLFGDDPATVMRYAGPFLQGLQRSGVVGCLKHWPGIGSVSLDPHDTLPVMDRTRQQLETTEFASFRGLLALNPGMVMVTHVVVPAIDPDLPATLSPKLVQGVLRGELGYDGVVMTDSLYMKGISLRYDLGEAAVMSVLAGDDLLEGAFDPASMRFMLAALKGSVASGRLSVARIDDSVRRVLTLKARYGLLPVLPPTTDGAALGATGAPATADANTPRGSTGV